MVSARTPIGPPPNGHGLGGRSSVHSTLFWGEDRRLVNQLLYHAARRSDPQFTWIEIGEPGKDAAPGEPVASGRIPANRRIVVRAEQLRPRRSIAASTLSTILTNPPEEAAVADLLLFVRLPALVQPILAGLLPSGGPRVLAVANADRLAVYYPPSTQIVGRFVRIIHALGVSLLVGYCGPDRDDLSVWDSVLRLREPEPGAPAVLRLDRGVPMPDWPGSEPWALDRLAGFRECQGELLRPPNGGR